MQWQELRTTYPDQYVLLEILDSHTEDNMQIEYIHSPSESDQVLEIIGRTFALAPAFCFRNRGIDSRRPI